MKGRMGRRVSRGAPLVFWIGLFFLLPWVSLSGERKATRVLSDEAKLFYVMGYLDGRSSAAAELARWFQLKEADPRLAGFDADLELSEVIRRLKELEAKKGRSGFSLREAVKSVISSLRAGS